MDRHYANAPISEAVIDLRVELPTEIPVVVFKRLGTRLNERFPVQVPITTIEMGFQQAVESPTRFHSAQEEVGMRLQSSSGDRVLQVQRAGFTYSHMRPYSSWLQFKAEARELWPPFVSATGAQRITRAAVRVINKLELPAGMADIQEYVTLHPKVPDGPLSCIDAFYMQLQLALTDFVQDCHAIVNIAHGQPAGADKSQLILDFDLFVANPLDVSSEYVWKLLDKISTAKNSVFESCITDKTRELIS